MDLTAGLVPGWTKSAALLLLAAILIRATRALAAPRALPSPHLFGATTVAIALMWTARVMPVPGFSVHLLGSALATWLLGPQLALLAVSAAALLAVGFGSLDWDMIAFAALIDGVLPVMVAARWLAACERLLGTKPFVYLLGIAFFGTALTVAAEGLANIAVAWMLGAPVPQFAWIALVPIAYAEAFLTGMITTILVVYRPQWVATFDDARYLRRPPPN